jgi:ankyrin repeat protein
MMSTTLGMFSAAVTQNNEKMIRFLLHLGAHPDVIDFAGRTALMHAVQYGHTDAVQLLRETRADAKVQDLEGHGKLNKWQRSLLFPWMFIA